jgi:flagellar hook-basal body complex protein FliE
VTVDGGIGPVDWRFRPIEPIEPPGPQAAQRSPLQATDAGGDFVAVLRGQLDQVIELQNEAEALQQQLAAGQIDDINQVVLAVQRADLALNFALELRNKVIEAYQEISRMQI